MSFLDKIFGRSKKAAGDLTGDDSMKREGMHQEAESHGHRARRGRRRSRARRAQPSRRAPRGTQRHALSTG